ETGARTPPRNFGGQGAELWCEGGEAAFIVRMIEESARHRDACRWFTTLVSKSANLPTVHRTLRRVEAGDIRTIEMAQGQKKSRIVAWTFNKGMTQVEHHV
ncbi:MAG TPA: RlmF-related methyltransferase, partial [Holophagaceae bacterium]|nr:RlmF-related methyltransferase [Holophagaceae bacterium]